MAGKRDLAKTVKPDQFAAQVGPMIEELSNQGMSLNGTAACALPIEFKEIEKS